MDDTSAGMDEIRAVAEQIGTNQFSSVALNPGRILQAQSMMGSSTVLRNYNLIRSCFRWLVLVCITLGAHQFPSYAQTSCALDRRSSSEPQAFVIGGGTIALPIGTFLLIRRGDELGAIRLTRIAQDTVAKPRASEWIGSISYESYFLADAKNSFRSSGVIKHIGEMEYGRYKGFGFHYSWQSGNHIAIVGQWPFRFGRQNMMGMSTFSKWDGDRKDRDFEFAPTSACELNQINSHDSRLRWYRFDPNQSSITVPLSDLPHAEIAPNENKN